MYYAVASLIILSEVFAWVCCHDWCSDCSYDCLILIVGM